MDSKNLLLLKILLLSSIHLVLGGNFFWKRRKVIIDTDAGPDDAVGILLALKYEELDNEIDIVAITCTYGNTKLENVLLNVRRILTVAKRQDIPIYAGAERPILEPWSDSMYFGQDGFNNITFISNEIPGGHVDHSKSAHEAMVHLVKEYPGLVTLIVLGPTTNLAKAIQTYPKFLDKVGQLVIMGGTVEGKGNKNVRKGVDFNFACDPLSNAIVFQSIVSPITLVPREASLNSPLYIDWRKYQLGSGNSSVIEFINEAEAVNKQQENKYWSSADSRAVSVAFWPLEVVSNYLEAYITPVAVGPKRGRLIVDKKGKINVKAVVGMNLEIFKQKLIHYLNAA